MVDTCADGVPGAADRVIATGAVGVVPTLAATTEGTLPWPVGVGLLRRLSLDGFGGERVVVQSLVEDVSAASHMGMVGAEARAQLADLGEVVRWLRSPDPGCFPDMIQKPERRIENWPRPGGVTWAPLLVLLLRHPSWAGSPKEFPHTLPAFHKYLVALGTAVVPMLQQVRRSVLPQRREALAVLADIGWKYVSDRDAAVIRRRVSALEPWAPFYAFDGDTEIDNYMGEWYAVQTTDQDAVMAAFELSDPIPAPPQTRYRLCGRIGDDVSDESLGASCSAYDDNYNWPGRAEQYGFRAYVSEPKDGWTLVFGRVFTEADLQTDGDWGFDEVAEQVRRLSEKFGRAYFFQWDPGEFDPWEEDGNNWILAAHGRVIERFEMHEVIPELASERWIRCGAVDPDEYRRWLDETLLNDYVKEKFPAREGEDLLHWAHRWCVDCGRESPVDDFGPLHSSLVCQRMATWFTDEDDRTGTGTLALTACGRQYGHRGLARLFSR